MHKLVHFIGFVISPVSVLIPLFLLVRSHKSSYLNTLTLLLISTAIADLISYWLWRVSQPNAVVLNTQELVQFILLSILYSHLLGKSFHWVILSLALVYVGVAFSNTLLFQNYTQMQTWTWTVGGVLFIVYSLLLFKHMLDNSPTTQILTYAPLWINLAIWFYFSFNLFLFLTSSYVFEKLDSTTATVFWSFHNINNIVKNLLFAVGVYYAGKSEN